MTSIRARIWNGRPAPCDHDSLPIARIGTVQPHGVMMIVQPDLGCVEHVSANVEEILGVPARAVLGHSPTVAFRDGDTIARLQDIMRPGRRYFENPTPLLANGRRFEAICHVANDRLVIEIEPYNEADHDYPTMVGAALDAIARQTTVAGLYEASAKMMHFCTGYDRVKLYKFVSHGHGVVVGEHHAPNSALPNSFLGYHFSASDIPEAAKEILRTGKTRQKPTQRGSVPLLTRGADGEPTESGPSIDMTDSWLRGIHPCDNGYNRNLGVGSNIIFPVMMDSTLWGLFVVHNREERFLNYDSRAVIEQLTMMFASRLIEVEASEARLDERQQMAGQMLATIEAGQAMLASAATAGDPQVHAIRLHAMHAVSRHIAALAPTYVSTNGIDRAEPGRAEDRFSADLLRVADADGAAVLRVGAGGHIHLVGETPDAVTVRGIASMFGNRLPGFEEGGWRVFATDALADYVPAGPELRQVASGVLAAPLGNRGDMILWFRRERIVDALWAGKPPTTAELQSEMMFRSRADFVGHRAPLTGASRPWVESEVALAAQFAAAVGDFWTRHAQGGQQPSTPVAAAQPTYEPVIIEPQPRGDYFPSRPATPMAPTTPTVAAGRWSYFG